MILPVIQSSGLANKRSAKSNYNNLPSFEAASYKGIYSSLDEVKKDLKEVGENFKLGQIFMKGLRTVAQKASDGLAKFAKDKDVPKQ